LKKIIGQLVIRRRLTKWAERGYFPNTLFRAPPGMGKTLLALCWGEIIKEHTGKKLYHYMCKKTEPAPVTEEVIVLDEIHNLPNEEDFYNQDFGIIGCTTEGAPISEAFQSRFHVFWLDPYNVNDLAGITKMYAPQLMSDICFVVALRARSSPRTARKLGEELQVLLPKEKQTKALAVQTLEKEMGVYEGGYTKNDFQYLKVLQQLGRASLHTIAVSSRLPEMVIRDEVEPFLLQNSLVRISSRGRELV